MVGTEQQPVPQPRVGYDPFSALQGGDNPLAAQQNRQGYDPFSVRESPVGPMPHPGVI